MAARKHVFVRYREKHDLSQQQLAERLEVSRQLIGLIENGDREISPRKAQKWELILGIPREELCPEVFKRDRPSAAQPA